LALILLFSFAITTCSIEVQQWDAFCGRRGYPSAS
jgi:hypothetical protein